MPILFEIGQRRFVIPVVIKIGYHGYAYISS